MSLLTTLLASCLVAAPPKPVVVVLDREPTDYDRFFTVTTDEKERDRLAKEQGFVAQETAHFLLLTPRNLLRLDDAKAATSLMRLLGRRSAGGERVLSVKDLDPNSAEQIRTMVRGRVPSVLPDARAADSPDLRLSMGTMTRFDLRLGKQNAELWLMPGAGNSMRNLKLIKDAGMALPASPPEEPTRSGTASSRPANPPSAGNRLTFLVPPAAGDDAMAWIGEAQAILAKEAKEARQAWKDAHEELLRSLASDVKENFVEGAPTDPPTIGGLNPEARFQALSLFSQTQRGVLGGLDASGWVNLSQTAGVTTMPVLTLHVAKDTGFGVGYSTWQIPFECPIGP